MEAYRSFAGRFALKGLIITSAVLCFNIGYDAIKHSVHKKEQPSEDIHQGPVLACQMRMLGVITNMKSSLNQSISAIDDSGDLREILLKSNVTEICGHYHNESKMARHALLNVFNYNVPFNDVTLVTQVSFERMDRLIRIAESWPGPISVAVYLRAVDISGLLLGHVCEHASMRHRTNILMHLSIIKGMFYPVNYLRNVALNASTTKYVYLTDADMIPSPTLYSELTNYYIPKQIIHDKQAVVVPSFGAKFIHHLKDFPNIDSKEQIIRLWDSQVIEPFLKTKKKSAHFATNFPKWKSAEWPYSVHYEQDFEPYVVMFRQDVPPYYEGFIGRNRNKLSQIEEMAKRNVKFIVGHNLYAVHLNHTGREIANHDAAKYFRCTMDEYRKFKQGYKQNLGLE